MSNMPENKIKLPEGFVMGEDGFPKKKDQTSSSDSSLDSGTKSPSQKSRGYTYDIDAEIGTKRPEAPESVMSKMRTGADFIPSAFEKTGYKEINTLPKESYDFLVDDITKVIYASKDKSKYISDKGSISGPAIRELSDRILRDVKVEPEKDVFYRLNKGEKDNIYQRTILKLKADYNKDEFVKETGLGDPSKVDYVALEKDLKKMAEEYTAIRDEEMKAANEASIAYKGNVMAAYTPVMERASKFQETLSKQLFQQKTAELQQQVNAGMPVEEANKILQSPETMEEISSKTMAATQQMFGEEFASLEKYNSEEYNKMMEVVSSLRTYDQDKWEKQYKDAYRSVMAEHGAMTEEELKDWSAAADEYFKKKNIEKQVFKYNFTESLVKKGMGMQVVNAALGKAGAHTLTAFADVLSDSDFRSSIVAQATNAEEYAQKILPEAVELTKIYGDLKTWSSPGVVLSAISEQVGIHIPQLAIGFGSGMAIRAFMRPLMTEAATAGVWGRRAISMTQSGLGGMAQWKAVSIMNKALAEKQAQQMGMVQDEVDRVGADIMKNMKYTLPFYMIGMNVMFGSLGKSLGRAVLTEVGTELPEELTEEIIEKKALADAGVRTLERDSFETEEEYNEAVLSTAFDITADNLVEYFKSPEGRTIAITTALTSAILGGAMSTFNTTQQQERISQIIHGFASDGGVGYLAAIEEKYKALRGKASPEQMEQLKLQEANDKLRLMNYITAAVRHSDRQDLTEAQRWATIDAAVRLELEKEKLTGDEATDGQVQKSISQIESEMQAIKKGDKPIYLLSHAMANGKHVVSEEQIKEAVKDDTFIRNLADGLISIGIEGDSSLLGKVRERVKEVREADQKMSEEQKKNVERGQDEAFQETELTDGVKVRDAVAFINANLDILPEEFRKSMSRSIAKGDYDVAFEGQVTRENYKGSMKELLQQAAKKVSERRTKLGRTGAEEVTAENIKELSQNRSKGETSLLKQAVNVGKATGSKTIIHDSTESFQKEFKKQTGKISYETKGFIVTDDGTIHINMEQARPDTVFHEAAHPIVTALAKNGNMEALNKLKFAVEAQAKKGDKLAMSAIEFGREYDSDYEVADETVVQYIAAIAEADNSTIDGIFESVREFFIDMAKMVGFDISENIKSSDDIKKIAKKISRGMRKGRKIKVDKKAVDATKGKEKKVKEQKEGQRYPSGLRTAAKAGDARFTEENTPNRAGYEKGSSVHKNISVLIKRPIMNGVNARKKKDGTYTLTTIKKVHDEYIRRTSSNLEFIFDKMDEAGLVDEARMWYDGANKIANDIAERENISIEQSSGMLAVLSPTNEWNNNVAQAIYIADMLSEDPEFSEDVMSNIEEWAKANTGRFGKIAETLRSNGVVGKKLSEINDEVAVAMYIMARNRIDKSTPVLLVSPDGAMGDPIVNIGNKKERRMMFQYTGPVAKAVAIYRDASSVSEMLGQDHKVRSFYNNIASPSSSKEVTLDTHAVKASQLVPVSNAHKYVQQTWGSAEGSASDSKIGMKGTYALDQEAYNLLAEKKGFLPREIQSIVWVGEKMMFDNLPEADKKAIFDIWNEFDGTNQSEIQNKIYEIAGEIKRPNNQGVDSDGRRGQQGELSGDVPVSEGSQGRNDGGVESGARGADLNAPVGEELEGITPEHLNVKSQKPDPKRILVPKSWKIEEDGDSFVFRHFSPKRLRVIDPKHFGKNRYTSDRRRHGVSFYYTRAKDQESMVGGELHVVKIPKHEVYPFNKDPHNFYDQAEKNFRKENGDMAFDFAAQIDYINVLAQKAGYKMTVAKWSRSYRGETTIKIKPEPTVKRQAPAGGRLFNNPLPEAAAIKDKYLKSKGLPAFSPSPIRELNIENAKSIADQFAAMKHEPNSKLVKEAYEAMGKEASDQYDAIISEGYSVEIYQGEGEPYSNSEEMIEDLRKNKHFYVLSTEKDFGETDITDDMREENPLLRGSGKRDINGEELLINDTFRVVHDFFGHSVLGNSFGPIGEENAWNVHVNMFSPLAARAMTTETRGQNSWVNFGPHMRNEDGSIKKKGDKGYLGPRERPFADQKIGLMPESVSTPTKQQKPIENIFDTHNQIVNKYPNIKGALDEWMYEVNHDDIREVYEADPNYDDYRGEIHEALRKEYPSGKIPVSRTEGYAKINKEKSKSFFDINLSDVAFVGVAEESELIIEGADGHLKSVRVQQQKLPATISDRYWYNNPSENRRVHEMYSRGLSKSDYRSIEEFEDLFDDKEIYEIAKATGLKVVVATKEVLAKNDLLKINATDRSGNVSNYWGGTFIFGNTIVVNPAALKKGATLSGTNVIQHEAAHAFTAQLLTADANNLTEEQAKFKEEIKEIFNENKNTLFKPYGLTNELEFVAEFYSNNNFRNYLKNENITLLRRIIKLITGVLGIDNSRAEAVLSDFKKNVFKEVAGDIAESSPKIQEMRASDSTIRARSRQIARNEESFTSNDIALFANMLAGYIGRTDMDYGQLYDKLWSLVGQEELREDFDSIMPQVMNLAKDIATSSVVRGRIGKMQKEIDKKLTEVRGEIDKINKEVSKLKDKLAVSKMRADQAKEKFAEYKKESREAAKEIKKKINDLLTFVKKSGMLKGMIPSSEVTSLARQVNNATTLRGVSKVAEKLNAMVISKVRRDGIRDANALKRRLRKKVKGNKGPYGRATSFIKNMLSVNPSSLTDDELSYYVSGMNKIWNKSVANGVLDLKKMADMMYRRSPLLEEEEVTDYSKDAVLDRIGEILDGVPDTIDDVDEYAKVVSSLNRAVKLIQGSYNEGEITADERDEMVQEVKEALDDKYGDIAGLDRQFKEHYAEEFTDALNDLYRKSEISGLSENEKRVLRDLRNIDMMEAMQAMPLEEVVRAVSDISEVFVDTGGDKVFPAGLYSLVSSAKAAQRVISMKADIDEAVEARNNIGPIHTAFRKWMLENAHTIKYPFLKKKEAEDIVKSLRGKTRAIIDIAVGYGRSGTIYKNIISPISSGVTRHEEFMQPITKRMVKYEKGAASGLKEEERYAVGMVMKVIDWVENRKAGTPLDPIAWLLENKGSSYRRGSGSIRRSDIKKIYEKHIKPFMSSTGFDKDSAIESLSETQKSLMNDVREIIDVTLDGMTEYNTRKRGDNFTPENEYFPRQNKEMSAGTDMKADNKYWEDYVDSRFFSPTGVNRGSDTYKRVDEKTPHWTELDPVKVVLRHAKSTSLDYHAGEEILTAGRALGTIAVMYNNTYDGEVATAMSEELKQMLISELVMQVSNEASAWAMQAQRKLTNSSRDVLLSTPDRWIKEFTSNGLKYIASAAGPESIVGAKEFMRNNRVYKEIQSKMGSPVVFKHNQYDLYEGGKSGREDQLQVWTNKVATFSDTTNAKYQWVTNFNSSFKRITGERFSAERYESSRSYRDKFKEEIEAAAVEADYLTEQIAGPQGSITGVRSLLFGQDRSNPYVKPLAFMAQYNIFESSAFMAYVRGLATGTANPWKMGRMMSGIAMSNLGYQYSAFLVAGLLKDAADWEDWGEWEASNERLDEMVNPENEGFADLHIRLAVASAATILFGRYSNVMKFVLGVIAGFADELKFKDEGSRKLVEVATLMGREAFYAKPIRFGGKAKWGDATTEDFISMMAPPIGIYGAEVWNAGVKGKQIGEEVVEKYERDGWPAVSETTEDEIFWRFMASTAALINFARPFPFSALAFKYLKNRSYIIAEDERVEGNKKPLPGPKGEAVKGEAIKGESLR